MDLSETFDRAVHNTISSANPETASLRSDDSPATKAKLWMISTRAHHVAHNVSKLSEHGAIRTQGYTALKDGRTAFLKRSQDESNQGDVLGINIGFSSDFHYFIYVAYDLRDDCINAFEVRRMGLSPIIIYDKYNVERQKPTGLTLCDIAGFVDKTMGMVDTASKHIEEKMPASTPNSLRII